MPAKDGFRTSAHYLETSLRWTRVNFAFLRDHIMHHLTAKGEFRASRGSASKSQHPDGRPCTWDLSRILLVQNPLMTQQTCPTRIHRLLLLDQGFQGVCLQVSASRWETVHMGPFQDTSCPESTDDPADLSNQDTQTAPPRSCGISVTSSYAESDQI